MRGARAPRPRRASALPSSSARRIASAQSSPPPPLRAPFLVARVEDEIDRGANTVRSRSGSRCSARHAQRDHAASRILRFARTSRCASVASGTMNTRAISGVAQARRRGSASAQPVRRRPAPGDSTRRSARVVRRECSTAPLSSPWELFARGRAAPSCWRECLLPPIRSIARFRAVATIHAPGGSRGVPSRGQRSSCPDERVLHRVLGKIEIAEDAAEDRDAPCASRPGRRGRESL